jgi:hypothetical protein
VKVLAIILAFVGAVSVVGATTTPAPVASASTPMTTTTASTTLDRFDRPPRMAATSAPVAAVAKPLATKAAPKAHKAAVRHVQKVVSRVHTASVSRTYAAPKGILPSAYRGPYYDARYESFRLCVINRESHGNYAARNSSSSASGAYQFLKAWTATIQGWTGEHVAIWQMSRYAQDLAFWRALDHGRGAHNWSGGGYHC